MDNRNKSASKNKNRSRINLDPRDIDGMEDMNASQNRSMSRSMGNMNSVYTKILNSTQSNKIKKLVGEKNCDLDVSFFLLRKNRASFCSEIVGVHLLVNQKKV